jgi:hypothetical protein
VDDFSISVVIFLEVVELCGFEVVFGFAGFELTSIRSE